MKTKTNPLLFILMILALVCASCASTGWGRKAPASVASQGVFKAYMWSVLTCPDDWDKSFDPLDTPGQRSEIHKPWGVNWMR